MKIFFRDSTTFAPAVYLSLLAMLLLPAAARGDSAAVTIANRSGTARLVSNQTWHTGSGLPPGPFGDHWVRLRQNGKVTSYDSRIGPISVSEDHDCLVGSNVNPNDSQSGVHLDENSEVWGNIAVAAPEEDGRVTNQNNSIISGEIRYNQPKWDLLPLDMPGFHTEAGGGPYGEIIGEYGSKPGNYEVTNNGFRAYNNAEVTFGAGKYHFDTFELSNNVEFRVDPDIGPGETVDIYVESSIIFENNSELLPPIAITGDTTKLRFYFNGTTKVDLSNNVEFFGVMYAPNAEIEVRNNDSVFGNLIGKQVYIWNNATVHFDKALVDEDFSHIVTGGIPALPHERVDWREDIQ